MLTAATNPDVAPFGWGYALGAVICALLLIGPALLITYWQSDARQRHIARFDTWLDQRIEERDERARQEIADPVLAARRGHSTRLTRERASAPRQPTARSPR